MIGDNSCAASYSTAVTAAFANHGALSHRDRALVDERDTLHTSPSAGMVSPDERPQSLQPLVWTLELQR